MSARGSALGLVALLALSCGDEAEETRGARVYASVSSTAEVLAIDEATHEVLTSIPVGAGPAIIIKTPDGKKVYTANWADESVSIIDTRNDTAKTIAMEGRPSVIAMDPSGKYVYVGLHELNAIALLDIATELVVRSIPQSVPPAALSVSPDGKSLYVARTGAAADAAELVAIDVATGDEPWPSVEIGMAPASSAISSDGRYVYTLNRGSDDISVVDTSHWNVSLTIANKQGSGVVLGALTPNGERLYVANQGTEELLGIDTRSHAVVQTIALAARPSGIAFNADGSRLYVADVGAASGPGQVRAFSTLDGTQVGSTIVTGPGATSVVVVAADE